MRFTLYSGLAVLISGLVFVLVYLMSPKAQDMDMDMITLKPDDRRVVALGARVYTEACASCHGADLEGEENWREPLPGGGFRAPPHDETGHTWHHPDRQLFRITKLGRTKYMATYANRPDFNSGMVGFEDSLTDAEIIAVLSYIKSTWPPHIKVQHDLVNRNVHPEH
ncbi:MAG: cytochrome c [Sphingomonadales bacterium]